LPPVEIDGRQLADGAIVCTVPARYAVEQGADVVIAVAIDKDIVLSSELQTAVDIYVRAGEIMGFHLEQYDLKNAHLIIRPELGSIHWADFSQSRMLIALGEAAALDSLPELKRLAKSISRGALMGRIRRSVKGLFVRRPSRIG